MRGHLLIFTFGLAILFHGATSSRSSQNAGRRQSRHSTSGLRSLHQLMDKMGAASYEVFSTESDESSEPLTSVRRHRQLSEETEPENSAEFHNYQGVQGQPGIDFPVLTRIPKTSFTCRKVKSGYYADLETNCQVFHICDTGRKISFLCPNGTIFHQTDQICDWWFKVDCGLSPKNYEQSAERYASEEEKRKSKTTTEATEENFDDQQSAGAQNYSQNSRPIYSRTSERYRSRNRHTSSRNHARSQKPEINQSNSTSSGTSHQNFNSDTVSYSSSQIHGPNQLPSNNQNSKSPVYVNRNKNDQSNTNSNENASSERQSKSNNSHRTSSRRGNTKHYIDSLSNVEISEERNSREYSIQNSHHYPGETQYTAETASFANNRYNGQQQRINHQSSRNNFRNNENKNVKHNDSFSTANPHTIGFTTAVKPTPSTNFPVYNPPQAIIRTTPVPITTQQFVVSNSFSVPPPKPSKTGKATVLEVAKPSFDKVSYFPPHSRDIFENSQHIVSRNITANVFTSPPIVKNDTQRAEKQSPVFLSANTHEQIASTQSTPYKTTYFESPTTASTSRSPITVVSTTRTPTTFQSSTHSTYSPPTSTTAQTPTISSLPGHFVTFTFPVNRDHSTTELPETTQTYLNNFEDEVQINFGTTTIVPLLREIKQIFTETTKQSIETTTPRVNPNYSQFPKDNTNPSSTTTTKAPTQKEIKYSSHYSFDSTSSPSTVAPQFREAKHFSSSQINVESSSSSDIQRSENQHGYKFSNTKSGGFKIIYDDTPPPPPLLRNEQSTAKPTLSPNLVPPKVYSKYSRTSWKPKQFTPAVNNTSSTPKPTARQNPKTSFRRVSYYPTFTTSKPIKYSQSATKYSPTVPTITPRPPTQPTVRSSSYTATPEPFTSPATPPTPIISENALRMIDTLNDLEAIDEKTPRSQKFSASRPGLKVPPSSSPDTLHSLAIYFASAAESHLQNNSTINNESNTPPELGQTLLTKNTLHKYVSLFHDKNIELQTPAPTTAEFEAIINRELVENDLDVQQSRGPVAPKESNITNIRRLARVFTHALSEYLKDPETFRKVLSEIRPTEPPEVEETTTISTTTDFPTTEFTDHPSITKEEGEVLDFSDVIKTTPRSRAVYRDSYTTTPYTPFETSTINYETSTVSSRFSEADRSTYLPKYDEINTVAISLNSGLELASTAHPVDLNLNENADEDDYFPATEQGEVRTTPNPYGLGVKPENSTPIGIDNYTPTWNINFADVSASPSPKLEKPSNDLLPPSSKNEGQKTTVHYFIPEELNNLAVVTENTKLETRNQLQEFSKPINDTNDEERLQIAYSQSFVAGNNIIDRGAKSVSAKTAESSSTDSWKIVVTTSQYDSTTESTTPYPELSTTKNYDFATSTASIRDVPENHWTNSPQVAELWNSAVAIDPMTINLELSENSGFNKNTYLPKVFTTELPKDIQTTTTSYDTTTLSNKEATTDYNGLFTTEKYVNDLRDINIAETRYGKSVDNSPQQFTIPIPTETNTTEIELEMKVAKQMFGDLNTTEQDMLMEKMKEADSNKKVRKLILLLINTCDFNQNDTSESARKIILDALLNTPVQETFTLNTYRNIRENEEHEVQVSSETKEENVETSTPSASNEEYVTSTTTIVPETTTFYSHLAESTTEDYRVTTEIPEDISTSTIIPDILSNEKNVDLSSQVSSTGRTYSDIQILGEDEANGSDGRALKLLRSLYGLAAKWGRK